MTPKSARDTPFVRICHGHFLRFTGTFFAIFLHFSRAFCTFNFVTAIFAFLRAVFLISTVAEQSTSGFSPKDFWPWSYIKRNNWKQNLRSEKTLLSTFRWFSSAFWDWLFTNNDDELRRYYTRSTIAVVFPLGPGAQFVATRIVPTVTTICGYTVGAILSD